MKIYIVTNKPKGSWDLGGIEGAYLSRKEAEKYVKEAENYNVAYIFEIREFEAKISEPDITRLREINKEAITLLNGYAQWEADIINEDKLWWPNRAKDVLRGKLYNTMIELQKKRNDLLSRYKM